MCRHGHMPDCNVSKCKKKTNHINATHVANPPSIELGLFFVTIDEVRHIVLPTLIGLQGNARQGGMRGNMSTVANAASEHSGLKVSPGMCWKRISCTSGVSFSLVLCQILFLWGKPLDRSVSSVVERF
jgi:hypothetical protein